MRIEQFSAYPVTRDTWPVQDAGATGTTTDTLTGASAPVEKMPTPVPADGASNGPTVDLTAVLDLHIRVQISGESSNGHGFGRLNHQAKRFERIVDHAMRDLAKAADAAGVSRSDVEAALKTFRGSVDQALKDFRDNKDGKAFVDAVKGAVTTLGSALGSLFTTNDGTAPATTTTPATTDTTTPATTTTSPATTTDTTSGTGSTAATATTATTATTGTTGASGVPVLTSSGSLFAKPGANGLAALFDRLLRAVESWASDTQTKGAHGHRHHHEHDHDDDDATGGTTATPATPATTTGNTTTPTTGTNGTNTTPPATTTPSTNTQTSTTNSFEFTFALYASFRYTQTTTTNPQVGTTA